MRVLHWFAGAALGAALAAGPALAQEPAKEPATEPAKELREVSIVAPTPSSTSWPIWFALEGGYFEKYGLKVNYDLAVHPAAIAGVTSGDVLTTNYGLDTALLAAMKGRSLVVVSSPLNRGQFVLVGGKDWTSPKDFEGKKMAIGRVGDPPYHYTVALLDHLGVDTSGIEWIGAGANPQRVLAVRNGLADGALLTPPEHYILTDEGYKILADMGDYVDEVPLATTYIFRRATVEDEPELVEAVLKAHAEAVKRFYDDKEFVIEVLTKYAPNKDPKILDRLYEETKARQLYERIPLVRADLLKTIVARMAKDTPEAADFDFSKVILQGPVERLIESGFYRDLYGPEIEDEIKRKQELAVQSTE